MVSIICCYNNLSILENMLLKSLKSQDYKYELVLIDNTNNKYTSAAEALNQGADKSKGKYLVFVHQDVYFSDKSSLRKIVNYIKTLGDNAVVGVAGIVNSNGVISNITHGKERKTVGKHRVHKPERVQTLDEVLIGTSTNVFNQLKFDEETCDNWHLYGVDFCLSGASKEFFSYVIPLELYHKSPGNLSMGYFKTLSKVVEKHKKRYEKIYTTCSQIKTSFFSSKWNIETTKLKIFIKNNYKKSRSVN